jgi:hypothetical protein
MCEIKKSLKSGWLILRSKRCHQLMVAFCSRNKKNANSPESMRIPTSPGEVVLEEFVMRGEVR